MPETLSFSFFENSKSKAHSPPDQPLPWDGHIQSLDTRSLTDTLAAKGYALLGGPAGDQKDIYGALQNLLHVFGNAQGHERADENGIAVVQAAPVTKELAKEFKGLAGGALNHHTDGAYLCHVLEGGRMALPPDLILLQCVQPALSGGESELCDWQMIWNDMKASRRTDTRTALRELRIPQFSVKRADMGCKDVAVFERDSQDTIRLRWHDQMTAPEGKEWVLDFLKENYLQNPRYIKRLKMEAGDILVVDNTRMTHSRTDYKDDPAHPRRYHRVFVSPRIGSTPDAQHIFNCSAMGGDGYTYRPLVRPATSIYTAEPVPEKPLAIHIGIETRRYCRYNPSYSLAA